MKCAPELARWVWQWLVNRLDAWGGYVPWDQVGKEFVRRDGTAGKLQPTITRKGQLSLWLLERHFRAPKRKHLVGLHTTAPDNTSRWGDIDIDQHGADAATAAVNEAAAMALYGRLIEMGFHPLLWDSNGAGGFRLDVLLAEPVETPRLYRFLQQLVADHARYGLPAPPETFPKQPRLTPRSDGSGGYGNWCRVLGRHHSRDHWARVWDGQRWLAGEDAVAFVLALKGDPPKLLPEVPAVPEPTPASIFRTRATSGPAPDRLARQVRGYIARIGHRADGSGRNNLGYRFACWLTHDMALSDSDAMRWLDEWNSGNAPPLDAEELASLVRNARSYGQRAVGCGLSQPPPPRRGQQRQRPGKGHRRLRVRRGRKPHHIIVTFTLEIG